MAPFVFASPLGGDVEEICQFHRRIIRSYGKLNTVFAVDGKFIASPLDGDVVKTCHFQIETHVQMVTLILHHLLGAMLRENDN